MQIYEYLSYLTCMLQLGKKAPAQLDITPHSLQHYV